MVWSSVSPDGSLSVKANTNPMAANTVYTETNLNKDHFWNIGVDEDGHHKFAQMVATNDADKTLATNPSLSAGMDLSYYTRFKTPTEATVAGAANAQPFVLSDPTSAVLQLLGMRACAVFNVVAGVVTVVYKHNISSVAITSTGRFTATYTTALPSNSYMVLGGAIANGGSGSVLQLNIAGGTNLNSNKTVNQCLLRTSDPNDDPTNPLQAWFICFGG